MIAQIEPRPPVLAPPVFDEPGEHGLSTADAVRRLAEVAPNELHREEGTPWWRFLAGQFTSPVV